MLKNGGFEHTAGTKLESWAAARAGFEITAGEGRNGSFGLRCDSTNSADWYGASQSLVLNRTSTFPLVVRGWSKAANVNGGSDSDYSLYLDLIYADGTPLWGQTVNFRTGSHDWEKRELVVLPEKPVKSLTLHCLFRNHSGQVWFDDVSLMEVRTEGAAVLFQGVPVLPNTIRGSSLRNVPVRRIATKDGLELSLQDSTVTALRLGRQNVQANVASGFLARDVVTNSDFYNFEGGKCRELGLKLQYEVSVQTNHIVVEGRLSDTQGRDRAVTLVFALPLDATGWIWGDDIHQSRVIGGSGEFSKLVGIKCGATGTMSLYPLGAVANERAGLAVALDMGRPAQFRVGYHAGTKQLFIAYDFGLSRETERFPSEAEFRFVIYRFEPRWGFRAAFQKLTEIFPEYFLVRSRDQGTWMPFTDISTVAGWEDFGFKYHEGNNNVAWDDAHGILSFRYTEPMTWWMKMSKEAPRAIAEAARVRDELARGNSGSDGQLARVSTAAAMWDEWGEPCMLFRNEPWCNGAVWSLNPNPHLPPAQTVTTRSGANPAGCNAATIRWNDDVRESLYGPQAKGRLDGEYLDSLEGYVTADLNFRRNHFRYSTVPLTFSPETKTPALFKGLAVFEFTRWFCDRVHGIGKLTFANGVPYRFCYLCPWLDVLGTETDWLRQGKYAPASHEQMSLWRTLSGAKPYLLLMNTDYDQFTPDMVERYFQRSLFYGMFPGMFSHNAADNPYWQNPKWYNRDRPLFKRYLPIIRQVAQAGWQPVTHAKTENPAVLMERFGPGVRRELFFTIFNNSDSRQHAAIRIDRAPLRLGAHPSATELFSNASFQGKQTPQIDLAPGETKVLEIRR